MAKSNITNYAFLNEETKVKLYVNLPGVGNCIDENITLDYTEQSLCLTIKNYMSPSAKVEEEVDELLVVDTTPPAVEEEEKDSTKKGEDRHYIHAEMVSKRVHDIAAESWKSICGDKVTEENEDLTGKTKTIPYVLAGDFKLISSYHYRLCTFEHLTLGMKWHVT